MPYNNVPKNLWGKMDRCVKSVQKEQGVSKERAIKICYSSVVGKKSLYERAIGRIRAVAPTFPGIKELVMTGKEAGTPDAGSAHGPGGTFSSAGLENGEKGEYKCECLKCGHTFTSGEHCNEAKCPECGSTSCRREDRPGAGEKEVEGGIKAYEIDGDRYLVLWTSNAFKDREGEIFSTKAWQDYVDRRDKSGRQDRAWFWHVKGSDWGNVVWQGMVGRMLVEVVEVDDTDRGEKMFHAIQHPEDYKEIAPHGWGTSCGYVYRRSDKVSGVYGFVEKFETTVLPRHAASNLFGGIKEVMDMGAISEEKQQALISVFGEEDAAKILEDADKASDILENLVDWKEADTKNDTDTGEKGNVPPQFIKKEEDDEEEDEEEEDEEEEKKKDEGGKGVDSEEYFELELDEDLMAAIAGHVDVKEQVQDALSELLPTINARLEQAEKDLVQNVTEILEQTDVASKEQIVKRAITGRLRLTPYTASKDKGNTLTDEEKKEINKVIETKESDSDPVKMIVNRVMEGTL